MIEPLDVIVSGHLCLDIFPPMNQIPAQALSMPGHLWEVGPLEMATGGAVSNTGIALYRLGLKVGLMSKVGDDLLGQAIIASVNERDPDLGRLISVQPGQPTSYSVVLSPGGADRIFLHCTGTNNTFDAESIDYTRVAESHCRLFHLGYPPLMPRLFQNDGQSLVTIYRRVKEIGVVTSLDLAFPDAGSPSGKANWSRILHDTLPYVDIFLPSIDEILFMLRRDDFERWRGEVLQHLTAPYLATLADELLAMGAVVTGFKLGAMGIYLRTAGSDAIRRLQSLGLDSKVWSNVTLYHPAYQVQLVGTTGAGDSAYAGFLAAVLHGLSPSATLDWTCAVGACNVEAPDATSGIRSWQETEQRIAAGWPLRSERPAGF